MSMTRNGGKPNVKPIPYCPPATKGVQHRNAPGLGGTNYGNSGTQNKGSVTAKTSGGPGLRGSNHGKNPS